MSEVLVIAAGNEMRGDDAVGPSLVSFVEAHGWPRVRTLYDYQFQVEHAVDVSGAGRVLFIDAHVHQREAMTLRELTQWATPAAGSHALTPVEVLGVARRLGLPLPPCFQLAVGGRDFSLGAPMSAPVVAACRDARLLLTELLSEPDLARWRARCDRAGVNA